MVARDEVWRDVKGGEGRYQVSNLGRVRSMPRLVEREGYAPYWISGCIMAAHPNENGYLSIRLKRVKERYVHRMVAEAFIGPVAGMEVDHMDCDPGNNNLDNLQIVTQRMNKDLRRKRTPYCQRGHLFRDGIDWVKNGTVRQCLRCTEMKRLERKANK